MKAEEKHPVAVDSNADVLREYAITPMQMNAAERRIENNIARERWRGTIKCFHGTADDLRD